MKALDVLLHIQFYQLLIVGIACFALAVIVACIRQRAFYQAYRVPSRMLLQQLLGYRNLVSFCFEHHPRDGIAQIVQEFESSGFDVSGNYEAPILILVHRSAPRSGGQDLTIVLRVRGDLASNDTFNLKHGLVRLKQLLLWLPIKHARKIASARA